MTKQAFTVYGFTARGTRVKRYVATLTAVATIFANQRIAIEHIEVFNTATGELISSTY